MHKNLFTLLEETADRHPAAEAVVCDGRRCSFQQLRAEALRLAADLHRQGIRRGTRAAVLCRNGLPFVTAIFALMRLGAVCVPLNWRLTGHELHALYDHAGPDALIYDVEFSDRLPAPTMQCRTICTTRTAPPSLQPHSEGGALLHVQPDEHDPACIIYTAGTTGSPRGVLLSHGNLLANSAHYIAACGFAFGDRELAATQLFHISTLGRLFTYVRSGTTCILTRTFSPPGSFALIRRERITSITQTPTMYRMMLQAAPECAPATAAVTRVITGASPMSPPEKQALRGLFPVARFYDIFGQTEAGPGISVLGPDDFFRKPASVGRPMPGVRIAIIDDAGRELPPGAVGEITCSGTNIMQGYFRDEPASHAAFTDGRLRTGDMGYLDDEGFLFITGRKKDLIISGGINVYPPEVECVLRLHPDVADCAAFGVPDKTWGETVAAAVVLRSEGDCPQQRLIEHCKSLLAGFKCPRSMLVLDELPRNHAGKIMRARLIELWHERRLHTNI